MSREQVLSRIRAALKSSPHGETLPSEAAAYLTGGRLSPADRLSLFEHRLEEYGARTIHCTEEEIPVQISSILRQGGRQRIVVPSGFATEWLEDGIQWLTDNSLSYEELDRVDGVLTCAAVAIAISGSIVLQHGPSEGRRAITLIPDYHLCILREQQIVETLPEAFARLASSNERPSTFISGPSATADIEMTRIKGVHGPRFLDVLIVMDSALS